MSSKKKTKPSEPGGSPGEAQGESDVGGEVSVAGGRPQETGTTENDLPPVAGRAWQIAQLATSLFSHSPASSAAPGNSSSKPSDYLIHQVRDSVRKARIILEVAANPKSEDTRLSTWFSPNLPMSITDIEKRLEEIGWKTGSRTTTPSYNTINAQINKIRARWQDLLCRLETRASLDYDRHIRAADLVVGAVMGLCSNESIRSELPGLDDAADQFLKKILEEVSFPDADWRRVDLERHQALFDWCFSPPQETREARYRFHELLRVSEDWWEREVSDAGFLSRLGQISEEEAEERRELSGEWLPGHFRPRKLSDLDARFALSSQNYPLPDSLSFQAFNSDGSKSALEHYPFRPR